MTPNDAMSYLTQAMMLVLVVSMPPIVVASVVGIVVSLLQALTQVQEQTLAFAIKLVVISITIAALASNIGSEIMVFTVKLFTDFPRVT